MFDDTLYTSYWGDHTLSFRSFSVYQRGVIVLTLAECPSECAFPNVSPNAFSLFSECFLYGFIMLSEQTEYFPHVDFERFPNAYRRRRINLEWSELFPHAFRRVLNTFGKHSSCSRSIRGVRKAYGTQHLHIFISNAPRTRRTCRMLLECFPNTSIIHMYATIGWSMKIILNMHNTFLELPNAVPYASVRSRTASMLPEHTECFPNMIHEQPTSYSEHKRNDIRASVIGPSGKMAIQHNDCQCSYVCTLSDPSSVGSRRCSYS